MIPVICYDITDDDRREDVAALLSGYGPRVQLPVFECEVADADEARDLRPALRQRRSPCRPDPHLPDHPGHLQRAVHPRRSYR